MTAESQSILNRSRSFTLKCSRPPVILALVLQPTTPLLMQRRSSVLINRWRWLRVNRVNVRVQADSPREAQSAKPKGEANNSENAVTAEAINIAREAAGLDSGASRNPSAMASPNPSPAPSPSIQFVKGPNLAFT